ncbi:MAG: ester cyclase [Chloroflexi bacterium]|uniref:Ester cyclase n=1 Tax=Candidatus Chlorohelix allophototropha TaxID=3003348 RepID=A0A8T7M200_9CHLR|nr:ester cyclase [Chloroflexota bacterium]WJW65690.1 ester cyclase [Chloroflexota bacterium L227-S17]
MSTEQNKAAVRRFFLEAFSTGNVAILAELYAPGYVDHDPASPVPIVGVEGATQLILGYRAAFPDIKFTIEAQLAEGDLVATRWTARGTNTGPLMGMPASGKASIVTGLNIDRFVDGKIAEAWNNWDTLGMLQQLGVIPALGQ